MRPFLRCCLACFFFISLHTASIAQRSTTKRNTTKNIKVSGDMDLLEKEDVKWSRPDCRETNPINKENVADSYPFLSADGLRLYFTSNREGGHGRFFISTRTSVNEVFGEPKPLSHNLTDAYYAGSLTVDELTLCMVKSGKMYISVRSSKDSEFPQPVEMKETSKNYHFGPSISPNGDEIIVMETVNGKDIIRLYKRTGTNRIEPAGELDFPKDAIAGPGQFSKDGLSYYLSLEINGAEKIWQYTRASLSDKFANLDEFPIESKGLNCNVQPSVNADASILVFVTSPNNRWEGDDIILINRTTDNGPDSACQVVTLINDCIGCDVPDTIVAIFDNADICQVYDIVYDTIVSVTIDNKIMEKLNEAGTTQLNIYPNPFATTITITINELLAPGAVFSLYDLLGKKIKQQKLNSLSTNLTFDKLLPGLYIYKVMDGKGKSVATGKLVKN